MRDAAPSKVLMASQLTSLIRVLIVGLAASAIQTTSVAAHDLSAHGPRTTHIELRLITDPATSASATSEVAVQSEPPLHARPAAKATHSSKAAPSSDICADRATKAANCRDPSVATAQSAKPQSLIAANAICCCCDGNGCCCDHDCSASDGACCSVAVALPPNELALAPPAPSLAHGMNAAVHEGLAGTPGARPPALSH